MAVVGRALAQFGLEGKAAAGGYLGPGFEALADLDKTVLAGPGDHRRGLEPLGHADEHRGPVFHGLDRRLRHADRCVEGFGGHLYRDEQPRAPGVIGVGQGHPHRGGAGLFPQQAADVGHLALHLSPAHWS